jgi:hypothetical protein
MARHGLWPTPTNSDALKGYSGPPGEENDRGRETLSGAVQSRPDGKKRQLAALGGQLNPTWVEWLIGCPLGWTDSEHSETESSRNAPSLSGYDYDNSTMKGK